MRRRDFLAAGLAGATAVALAGAAGGARDPIRDHQTGLDAARPQRWLRPRSRDEVQALVHEAAAARAAICCAGRLHSSGGQALLDEGWMLDMTALDRVRSVDVEHGLIEVEAGAQWPAVVRAIRTATPRWAIRQKQTVSALTMGGTVSANAHGNGLRMPPIAADVAWVELVDADGNLRRCSREVDADWLRAALGGFGLMGVLTAVGLRLQRRVPVRSLVDPIHVDALAETMATHPALYASATLPVDPTSPDFLRRGLLLYEVEDGEGTPQAGPRPGSNASWTDQMALLHRAPSAAWARMCEAWLGAAGHTWWADDLLMQNGYVDGYHRRVGPGCDVMVEFMLGPRRFAPFMAQLRRHAREGPLHIVLCEIRHVAADVDSLLCYASKDVIAVVIAVHVPPDAASQRRVHGALGQVVDDALAHGGSFHPAFSWCATPRRMAAAFPQLEAFVSTKHRLDPQRRFRSQWYDRLMP